MAYTYDRRTASDDEDPSDVAEKIAKILQDDGYITKVWDRGSGPRVYVKRKLSKGMQDMGYIEVLSDERNYNGLSRNKAGIRDKVEDGLK